MHMFLLYKSDKTIWMFFRKFAYERDNPVNNQNIYNVEGGNRLSPSQQPLTTESVLFIKAITVLLYRTTDQGLGI
jgi:hypothetical protein